MPLLKRRKIKGKNIVIQEIKWKDESKSEYDFIYSISITSLLGDCDIIGYMDVITNNDFSVKKIIALF